MSQDVLTRVVAFFTILILPLILTHMNIFFKTYKFQPLLFLRSKFALSYFALTTVHCIAHSWLLTRSNCGAIFSPMLWGRVSTGSVAPANSSITRCRTLRPWTPRRISSIQTFESHCKRARLALPEWTLFSIPAIFAGA